MQSAEYASNIDTRAASKHRLSAASRLTEAVFGKSLAKQQFEQDVDRVIAQKQRKATQSKRLGATPSHVAASLTTLDDFVWTGTVYMGAAFAPITVVFDTASDWLVIADTACGSCTGGTYPAGNRSRRVNGEVRVDRSYGDIELTTYEY